MNKVNMAEKEASEVLHSLLSVDRRLEKQDPDQNQIIIVATDPFQNNSSSMNTGDDHSMKDALGAIQWHTPVMGHSIFSHGTNDSGHFTNISDQQVIWSDHLDQLDTTVQENSTTSEEIMATIYPIPNDTMLAEEGVKDNLLTKTKKKKPINSLENESSNKLEDNPAQVKVKFKQGCECRDSCYRGLNAENVYRHRLNIAELTKSEHDMYLMGVTMACIADPTQTSRNNARRRLRASYVYQGRRVCLDAFLYLENVTHYQLKRIRAHVMTHGVAPRVHGNMGKKPYNTFSLDIYQHATEFLKQYLEKHIGSKDVSKPIIIYGDSRKHIFDNYKEYGALLDPGVKLMGYSTFRHFMKVQFPNVKFSRTDSKKNWVKHNGEPSKIKDKMKDKLKLSSQEISRGIIIDEANVRLLQDYQNNSNMTDDLHQVMPIVVSEDNIHLQNVSVSISQPQQTFIVTPVSHLVQGSGQTIIHTDGWYSRQ